MEASLYVALNSIRRIAADSKEQILVMQLQLALKCTQL